MTTARACHAQHRLDPSFGDWFQPARPASTIPSVVPLPRLDLLGHNIRGTAVALGGATVADAPADTGPPIPPGAAAAGPRGADWTGWDSSAEEPKDDLPLSVLLDEVGDAQKSILAGRALRS